MLLEFRKRDNGTLRPPWYGRFEIDGKRHCAMLCRIAGKPHSSLSIKEAGNDAFEKSRQNARDQLVVKADQARDKHDPEHWVKRLHVLQHGEAISEYPLKDLIRAWDQMPKKKPNKDFHPRYIKGVHGTLQRFLNFVKDNHSTLVHAATGQPPQGSEHSHKYQDFEVLQKGITMRSRATVCVLSLALSWMCASPGAYAEEGGSGHYVPGSMASFADAVPPAETFVARYNLLYYEGDITPSRSLPFAGLISVGADVESWAHGLTLLWRPPLEIGENASYAMSATIPYVDINVSAEVTAAGVTARRSDSDQGLGDIVLMPLMLNYVFTRDLSTNFRLGFYAPTGDYKRGRLANTGKNYWTMEPTLALIYFGQENGREASVFSGVDFNTENKDTDYESGTQIHFDGTLAQHFPLAGGFAGAGVSGFWYKQVEADSGDGATLGNFKTMTTGLGPVLSYAYSGDAVSIVAELKWLHEFDTVKRLEGDYVWLKILVKL